MPFMFDLDFPKLTPELGVAIEQAVADAGAWPVRFTPGREERRWFGIRKHYPAVLEISTQDGRGHVLLDPDHWDETSWELRPDATERVATLIVILAEHAPLGFLFRATWAGSPVEHQHAMSAVELAALVRGGELNDHTSYLVESVE
ncbi:MAG: hypothetical protein J7513_00860 [Solirubrobacteraceae bacterium]|nr:hypothetical protein [Solirubrobacteraceae bacterium]